MQYPFNYAATWSAVASAGGKSATTIRTDSNTDFLVKAIQFSANLSAAVTVQSRSNITGIDSTSRDASFAPNTLSISPKFHRIASPNLGEVTGPGLHLVTLEFQTNDRPWQNIPTRADLVSGEPGTLYLLPDPIVVPANSTIQITLTNNMPTSNATTSGLSSSPTLDAMLVMVGLKMSPNSNRNSGHHIGHRPTMAPVQR